jgi:hypothetical protein
MKLINSLTPISIALQGLVAFDALGYTTERSYINPSAHYSTAGSVASGTTQAKYSGSLATIDYVNIGYQIYQMPNGWLTPSSSSTMNTLVIESDTWNPGCYSMGISEVWPPTMSGIGNTHNLPNINNTMNVGAWDEIY